MNKKKDLQIYFNLAQKQGNHPLSGKEVTYFRILQLLESKVDHYYAGIGKAMYRSGQFQKSLLLFKKAIIINPKNTVARACLVDCLRKVLSLTPRDAPHSLIPRILKKRNGPGLFLSFLQETASMTKDERSVLELYLQSAKILENLKMISLGREQSQIISETDAMRPQHYVQYANASIRQGLCEEAIAQFEQVLKFDPTNTLAINNIASLHYELGRFEKAFEVLDYIIKDGLQTNVTYLNLLLVLEEIDKDEEVIKKYRDYVQHYIQGNRKGMQLEYKIELVITERKLQSDLDEKAKEFCTKKLKALNGMASLLNN